MDPDLLLELDGRGPKYQQLARAFTAAIRAGRLEPGGRVPATRALAESLRCSRNVVLLAYDQLLAEGYLVAYEKAGTFVSPDMPRGGEPPAPSFPHAVTPGAVGRRAVDAAERARAATRRQEHVDIDFIYGLCEPDLRLLARFRQGIAAALTERSGLGYGFPNGDPRLREELARRLHVARGIARPPSQIVVTTGAQQALDLCARLLLSEGDQVIVEDPGYEGARAAFAAAGAEIIPVPVDGGGLNPAGLPADPASVRLIYLTPSHQFPTGAILTAARRQAILEWARQHGVLILEDDYDGDLRYGGAALKAVAAHDTDAGVIYCGTFAKALFPSIRLGFLSLPEALAGPATNLKWLLDRGSPALLQRAVAALMASGDYDRHLRRTHRRFARRRDVLVASLNAHLGDLVQIGGDAAGLHLVAWLPSFSAADIEQLEGACAARRVGVYGVGRHALLPLPRQGLVLGYGLLGEDEIREGVRRVAAAVRDVRGLESTP